MADIDVSYVDDVYLPVAASVENGGASGYMGSALPLDTFKQRVAAFQAGGWPVYSAYLAQFWPHNAFSALLPPELGGAGSPPALHLPAGYNTFVDTLSQAISSLYPAGDGAKSYLVSGVLRAAHAGAALHRPLDVLGGRHPVRRPRSAGLARGHHRDLRQAAVLRALPGHRAGRLEPLPDRRDRRLPAPPGPVLQGLRVPPGQHSRPEPDQRLHHPAHRRLQLPGPGGELPGQVQALLRGVAYDPRTAPSSTSSTPS